MSTNERITEPDGTPLTPADELVNAVEISCPFPMQTAHEFGFVATEAALSDINLAEDALRQQLGTPVELHKMPYSDTVRYDIYLSYLPKNRPAQSTDKDNN